MQSALSAPKAAGKVQGVSKDARMTFAPGPRGGAGGAGGAPRGGAGGAPRGAPGAARGGAAPRGAAAPAAGGYRGPVSNILKLATHGPLTPLILEHCCCRWWW